MYSLVPTPTFKRDLKRLSKKHWPMDELKTAVNLLAAGTNAELLKAKSMQIMPCPQAASGKDIVNYMLTALVATGC